MSAPVLLTGATGFLGRELARQLVEGGREVHALHRKSSDRSPLDGLSLHWQPAELGDAASLRAALRSAGEGVDLIHSAAVISYRSRDAGLQQRVNVEGTRNLLEVALETGVRRLVHISSVVAVGVSDGIECLTEDSPYNGARLGVDYVNTKREAEQLALAASGELDVVVVNPGAIFGPPTEQSNSAHFLRKLSRGRLALAPPGSVSVVGVEDTATGVLLALQRGQRGRRYLLTESNLRYSELLALGARLCEVRPPRATIPAPLWNLLGNAARIPDTLFPLERLTPQSMRMVGSHFRFDSTRARSELGWKPRPFEQVLGTALDALRSA